MQALHLTLGAPADDNAGRQGQKNRRDQSQAQRPQHHQTQIVERIADIAADHQHPSVRQRRRNRAQNLAASIRPQHDAMRQPIARQALRIGAKIADQRPLIGVEQADIGYRPQVGHHPAGNDFPQPRVTLPAQIGDIVDQQSIDALGFDQSGLPINEGEQQQRGNREQRRKQQRQNEKTGDTERCRQPERGRAQGHPSAISMEAGTAHTVDQRRPAALIELAAQLADMHIDQIAIGGKR